jgi:site-specific DNA-cytosine methylase
MSWFVKTKRAQSSTDDEKWVEGAVHPTLNAFDVGDTRAVALVIYPIQGTVIGRKDTAGPQGKGYGDSSDPMFTLDTTGGHAVAMTDDDTIVFHPHRTDGFRLQGETVNTLTAFMGTGGLNTPMVAHVNEAFPIQDGRDLEKKQNGFGVGNDGDPAYTINSVDAQAVATTSNVRRITPMECERLQGFPDNWTDGQADSHRYKQMGNAVTVNVIAWIGTRLP